MPPKKIIKLDPKQHTLFGLLGQQKQTDTNSKASKSETGDLDDNSQTEPTPTSSDKQKKQRSFQDEWTKYYSWLAYNKDENYMYCTLCTEAKKRNGMSQDAKCRNFQNSTLTRHAGLTEHKILIEAPSLRNDLRIVNEKKDSKEERAMQIVFRCLHFLIGEDIALVKFKPLVEFLHNLVKDGYDLNDMGVLKMSDIGYESSYTSSEILSCMADVVEDNLKSELEESEVVTVLADESTDIANHKRLVVYAQIISEDMAPKTRFVANVECQDATGSGIAKSIMNELNKRGVPNEKIMSLGSDGASVMTGKINGCAAVMRRENPHLSNIHCVAHKLALCTSQAAENIPLLKKHQQILTDLFYYFKGSAKRAAKLHEIQVLVDDPALTIKEIHSVRWLSYFNALTAVFRTIDSLMTYLADVGVNDPKANGLKKKIATDQFISISYMMMDAMAPVTVLSQFFQTENVDVALVRVKLDLCLGDLEKIKAMESPYLSKLKEDLSETESTFKEHQVTRTGFNLQNVTEDFINSLTSNIKSRFPDNDLLANFSVLALRPISFLSPQELDDFGTKEIQSLCDTYGSQQTVVWKEGGLEHQKTSQSLIDSEKTLVEWKLLKKVVLAEQYSRDSLVNLWQSVVKYHRNQFPNLTTLARLAITCAVHTAGCERGFSVQNRILTTFRNRLSVDTQQQLMQVKLETDSGHKLQQQQAPDNQTKTSTARKQFDFHAALNKWRQAKNRRIFKLKSLKN